MVDGKDDGLTRGVLGMWRTKRAADVKEARQARAGTEGRMVEGVVNVNAQWVRPR